MQGKGLGKNGHNGPIKIFFLIDELNIGGTETQLLWLSEKLPRSHFSPTIGVLRKSPYEQTLGLRTPLVNFGWQGLPLIKNVKLVGRLRRYFDLHDFDIVQTQFVESEIYGSLAALCCRPRPMLISTRRNLYHWITGDHWRFRLGRYLTRHVDHVLVNSQAVQKRCAELEKVPVGKMTMIQNAVAPARFQNRWLEQAKESLGFSAEDFVVGVVGNWRPVKGLGTFLAAAKIIAGQVPTARFLLAGSGPQEHELREAAQHLGIDRSTSFINNSPDIPMIIAAMDVAVQSSLSESFSNVLLEYMAAGKAIVATQVGDASMMLEDGVSGLLVRPEKPGEIAQAVVALAKNREWARTMGRQAQQSVSCQWSEDVILAKYQQFYADLVTGRERLGRDG